MNQSNVVTIVSSKVSRTGGIIGYSLKVKTVLDQLKLMAVVNTSLNDTGGIVGTLLLSNFSLSSAVIIATIVGDAHVGGLIGYTSVSNLNMSDVNITDDGTGRLIKGNLFVGAVTGL